MGYFEDSNRPANAEIAEKGHSGMDTIYPMPGCRKVRPPRWLFGGPDSLPTKTLAFSTIVRNLENAFEYREIFFMQFQRGSMIPDATVLVVDDIRNNRHILVRSLVKQGGMAILEAENGREALEILQKRPVDLVLLDILMPEIDGYEVLRQMKADRDLRRIPVIMITSIDDLSSAVQCIETGADDYLTRPFNPVILKARIHACLERKRLQDIEREYLRRYDAATGLPNADVFLERLEEEFRRNSFQRGGFCVLAIRLGRHRMILDSLGQRAAEAYAVAQTSRLSDLPRPSILLARLGPAEFAVLLSPILSPSEGTLLARRILGTLQTPLSIEGHEIRGRIRIGLAYSTAGYTQGPDMLRDARLAANTADRHYGYQIFDDAMHQEAMRRLILEPELEKAISGDQLRLHYQPIVDLNNGDIGGFEALVRWHHPQRGMISPDEFIPLAEETGQILRIGEWVVRTACSQAAVWCRHRPVFMGVNASAAQFSDSGFVDILESALANVGLDGAQLKIELTETEIIDRPDRVETVLGRIRELGVRAALDDFGTGYCSLSYLHRFRFAALKIDQSFVRDIDHRDRNRDIVQSTIMLAQNLKMEVIAEGIETMAEADALRRMGCRFAQGDYFHPPLSVDAASKLI